MGTQEYQLVLHSWKIPTWVQYKYSRGKHVVIISNTVKKVLNIQNSFMKVRKSYKNFVIKESVRFYSLKLVGHFFHSAQSGRHNCSWQAVSNRFPTTGHPHHLHLSHAVRRLSFGHPGNKALNKLLLQYYFLVNWVKKIYLTKCFFYSISYTLFFLPHWGCNQTHFDYFVLKELLAQDTHTNISLISFNCRCASSRWAATHTTCPRWSSSRQTKSRGKLEEEQQNTNHMNSRGS